LIYFDLLLLIPGGKFINDEMREVLGHIKQAC